MALMDPLYQMTSTPYGAQPPGAVVGGYTPASQMPGMRMVNGQPVMGSGTFTPSTNPRANIDLGGFTMNDIARMRANPELAYGSPLAGGLVGGAINHGSGAPLHFSLQNLLAKNGMRMSDVMQAQRAGMGQYWAQQQAASGNPNTRGVKTQGGMPQGNGGQRPSSSDAVSNGAPAPSSSGLGGVMPINGPTLNDPIAYSPGVVTPVLNPPVLNDPMVMPAPAPKVGPVYGNPGSPSQPGGATQPNTRFPLNPSSGGGMYQMDGAPSTGGSGMSAPMSPGGSLPPQSAPYSGGVPSASSSPTFGSGGAGGVGINPYLGSQIQNLGTLYGNMFNRQIAPQINSSAIMAGGYGSGADQRTLALAADNTMRDFGNAATGMLGQDWSNSQDRQLQNQQQMLGYASDQRNQDRADQALGASLYGQGTQGQWGPITSANGVYGNYTGFGNNTTSQGGGAMGGVGGALAGSLIYKNLFGPSTGMGTNPGGGSTGNGF